MNRITSRLGCWFLEWSGWYSQDISQRLLGHYRLYQGFKAKNQADTQLSLPLAYITHYRTLHLFKYGLSCIMAVLYYIFTLGDRYPPLSVQELNKQLINHSYSILQEFLAAAETDFEKALFNAIDQINGSTNRVAREITFVQNRLEHKVYNSTYLYFTEYNGTDLSHTHELKGKQTGVLSKKQLLIIFDLLAEKGKIEWIDYWKPNKLESAAELFHAVNGKSKSSWEEELNNYKDKGIYYYRDEGQLKELIKNLINLSEIARKSKLWSLAKVVDKKIMELEKKQ